MGWGRVDPYYGVLTDARFRRRNLTPEAKREFFDSGKGHIGHVLEIARRHLDSSFSPKRALDFGCGPGRMLIPLAAIAEHVVGLDVSPSMLLEAQRHCDANSVTNVSLLRSDDDLASLMGRFDFIHSAIVFQHIPVRRGFRILGKLLEHLDDRGIGVIHFTYAKARPGQGWGRATTRRLLRPLRKLKQRTGQIVLKRDPEMQMNSYDMNALLLLVQSAGTHECHIEYTHHGEDLGVFLYFQKRVEA